MCPYWVFPDTPAVFRALRSLPLNDGPSVFVIRMKLCTPSCWGRGEVVESNLAGTCVECRIPPSLRFLFAGYCCAHSILFLFCFVSFLSLSFFLSLRHPSESFGRSVVVVRSYIGRHVEEIWHSVAPSFSGGGSSTSGGTFWKKAARRLRVNVRIGMKSRIIPFGPK